MSASPLDPVTGRSGGAGVTLGVVEVCGTLVPAVAACEGRGLSGYDGGGYGPIGWVVTRRAAGCR